MREKSEKCERSNPADNVVRKGGGGGAPGASTAIHAAARGEAHSGAGGCGLKEAVAHGGPMLEQFVKDGILWEGLHVEQGQRGMVKEWRRRNVRD